MLRRFWLLSVSKGNMDSLLVSSMISGLIISYFLMNYLKLKEKKYFYRSVASLLLLTFILSIFVLILDLQKRVLYTFLIPIVYLIFYQILRQSFIYLYKREPVIAIQGLMEEAERLGYSLEDEYFSFLTGIISIGSLCIILI